MDDVRYVTTLEHAIRQAKGSGDKDKIEAAARAEEYLATLDVETRDLDTVRMEIVEHILSLKNGPAR